MTHITSNVDDSAVDAADAVGMADAVNAVAADEGEGADASASPHPTSDGPRLPVVLGSAAVIGAAYLARAGVRRLSGAPVRRTVRRLRHAFGR